MTTNETIKTLMSRRSVRAFKALQVDDETLDTVLEAGTYAPTGMGRQSPVIVAVRDKPTIEKLSQMNAAIMNASSDPFYGAPTVLIVLADRRVPTYREDGALVMGNLLNAAHAMGLGACWIHRAREEFNTPEGKALLQRWGLSPDYEGIGHCIIGYADGEPRPAQPRKANYIIRV